MASINLYAYSTVIKVMDVNKVMDEAETAVINRNYIEINYVKWNNKLYFKKEMIIN